MLPKTLLTQINSFDNQVKHLSSKSNPRYWFLSVIAELTPNKSHSFAHSIKQLMNQVPTDQQWSDWLSSNATVLKSYPNEIRWSYDWEKNGQWIMAKIVFPEEVIISTKNELPSDYGYSGQNLEVQESGILKSSPPFPNLYLFRINLDDKHTRATRALPPNIAHDTWLLEGITKLLGITNSNALIRTIHFNKETIKKIRRSFAISEPRYIGGGADGIAYDIGEGRILKLFKDQVSFEKANEAINRLHKVPDLAKTEAMIYDTGKLFVFYYEDLNENEGQGIYYYIIEKMVPILDFGDTVRNTMSSLLNNIIFEIYRQTDHWIAVKKQIKDPANASKIKQEVLIGAKKIIDRLSTSDIDGISYIEGKIKTLKPNWFVSYIEEVIIKYLTDRTDLHMGNLGVTNYGELRYFDPVYGKGSVL
jgi:hypothetical protein